jgi:hypothetical protein
MIKNNKWVVARIIFKNLLGHGYFICLESGMAVNTCFKKHNVLKAGVGHVTQKN